MGSKADIKKFRELVTKYVPCVGDVNDNLDDFFNSNYTIVFLEGDGLFGYTEEEDHIFWCFAYDDNKLQNTRKIYKIAKKMTKKILYCGISDKYRNNSIKLEDDLYQLVI